MTQQTVFKKINYPILLRKKVLSLALDTAELNSNIKTMIVDRDLKLDYLNKIKSNMKEVKDLLKKVKSSYLSEIEHPSVKELKERPKEAFKPYKKEISAENYDLLKEINEIKEKLAKI